MMESHALGIRNLIEIFPFYFQMRQEMISQKEGEMEITVLTHMDDMKRVSLRTLK